MNKTLALGALALTLLPMASSTAFARSAGKHSPKAASVSYQCQKCHMQVSAAVAKKDGYKDPMDGGKLVPMTQTPAKASPAGKPMGSMKM